MLAPFFLLDIAAAAPGAALTAGASGSYAITDTEEALQSRSQAAVQATVEPLNFALRSIASKRLEEAMTWCSRYTFTIDDRRMSVQCDDLPAVQGALNGAPTRYTSDKGTSYSVTVSPGEDHAVFTFTGQYATQITTYRFSDTELQVTKEIHNDNLEVPLHMQINYARAQTESP